MAAKERANADGQLDVGEAEARRQTLMWWLSVCDIRDPETRLRLARASKGAQLDDREDHVRAICAFVDAIEKAAKAKIDRGLSDRAAAMIATRLFGRGSQFVVLSAKIPLAEYEAAIDVTVTRQRGGGRPRGAKTGSVTMSKRDIYSRALRHALSSVDPDAIKRALASEGRCGPASVE